MSLILNEVVVARRLRWSGLAGIVGGLLWVALSMLRRATVDGPLFGFSYEDYGRLKPLLVVVLWFALAGMHRLYRGRAGRWERWGYRGAVAGLGLILLGLASERWLIGEHLLGQPIDEEHDNLWVVARLVTIAGAFVLPVGLLAQGVGVWRARVAPLWARPTLVLLAVATAAAQFLIDLPAVDGLFWALVGTATLATSAPSTGDNRAGGLTLRAARAAFLSRATLISGVLAVGAWSLDWSWVVGVLVVLLLYAHEIGHVLAALWRGVEVKRAPLFLPGLGAFIETAPGASAWDDVWTSLGGPLFGSLCALAAKVAGQRLGSPASISRAP